MQHLFSGLLRPLASFAVLAAALGATACAPPNGAEEDNPTGPIGELEEQLATPSMCPPGYVIIQGGAGNDVINVSVTPNAYGFDPNTQHACIFGNGGNDTITGGNLADWIAGGMGNDTIHGGGGNDYLNGEPGLDTIFGDAGDDTVVGDGDANTLDGGAGNDTLWGGPVNDIIHGGDGNDSIQGVGGDDQLFGDNGNDDVQGGAGNDICFGGAGDDTVYGQDGTDTLHGDDGNDHLFAGAGDDTLEGGNGSDALQGDDGNDHLWGDFINNAGSTVGTTADTLHGNNGNDDLHGGPGNDILYGDDGADTLNGDDGDDRIVAGTGGPKTISGGTGNDLAKGNGTGTSSGDDNNDVLVVSGTANGGNGTDACTGTSCELSEPPSFCTSNTACASGQRCAVEVGVCIYCQSDSECTAGHQCIPTVGCNNKEGICNDGIDNDGDGAIDCADSDCLQDVNCQTGVIQEGNPGVFHNCITNKSGQVKCWGRNTAGELGYYPAGGHSTSATAINYSLTSPKMTRGGSSHTCAMLASGSVECWGKDDQGQLGDGTTTFPTGGGTAAKTVVGVSTATQLTSGGNNSCVVLSNGTVQCWGQNNFGQLGTGTTATRSSNPVTIAGLGGTVVEVKMGVQHVCARLTSGLVQCWGRNHVGQLGNGTTANSSTPVTVQGVGSVAQIASGGEFTCARRASGLVFCWGANYAGQLGTGNTTQHTTAVQTSNITDAADLASGWYHSCIVRANGAGIKCWGMNASGQIGTGTTSASVLTPTLLGLYDGTNLGMGQKYSCVRRTAGTLACWGDNTFGQIGDGTTTNRPSPVTVPNVP